MKQLQILHDDAVDLSVLAGKTIAVLGYGAQGRAQALNMRDSGLKIIVGNRPGKSEEKARQEGFSVMSVAEASKQADILMILLPDEIHGPVFDAEIAPYLAPGKTIITAHGFSVAFGQVKAPSGVDVIMVAPKGPGNEVRKLFLAGFSTPGLIAVQTDASGHARTTALAIAKAQGLTRAGVMECTMAQEACEDIFGEQNVLCGGMVDLMKYAFEVLVEAGYPPEIAYFECVHEVKLVTDLVHTGGIQWMNEVISNTAEWGEYVNGPKVFTPDIKERMRACLREIENGTFAREWVAEAQAGCPNLKAKREAIGKHPVEITGKIVRALFSKK